MILPSWFDYAGSNMRVHEGFFTFHNRKFGPIADTHLRNTETDKRERMAPIDRAVLRFNASGGSTLSPTYANFVLELSDEIKHLQDAIPMPSGEIMNMVEADLEVSKMRCLQGLIPNVRPMPVVNGALLHTSNNGALRNDWLLDASNVIMALLEPFSPFTPEFPLTIPLDTSSGYPHYVSDRNGDTRKTEYLNYLYGQPLLSIAKFVRNAEWDNLFSAYRIANITTVGKRTDQADAIDKKRFTYKFEDAESLALGRLTDKIEINPFTELSSKLRAPKARNVYGAPLHSLLILQSLFADLEYFLKSEYRSAYDGKSRSLLTLRVNEGGFNLHTYDTSNWDYLISSPMILMVADCLSKSGYSTSAVQALMHFYMPMLLSFGTRKGKADSWSATSSYRYNLDAALLSGTYLHTTISNLVHTALVLVKYMRDKSLSTSDKNNWPLIRSICNGTDPNLQFSVNSDDLMVLSKGWTYISDPKIVTEDIQEPAAYLGYNFREFQPGYYKLAHRSSSFILNMLLREINTDFSIAGDVYNLRRELYQSTGAPYIDELDNILNTVAKHNYDTDVFGLIGYPTGKLNDVNELEKLLLIKPSMKYYMDQIELIDIFDDSSMFPKSVIPLSMVLGIRSIFDL